MIDNFGEWRLQFNNSLMNEGERGTKCDEILEYMRKIRTKKQIQYIKEADLPLLVSEVIPFYIGMILRTGRQNDAYFYKEVGILYNFLVSAADELLLGSLAGIKEWNTVIYQMFDPKTQFWTHQSFPNFTQVAPSSNTLQLLIDELDNNPAPPFYLFSIYFAMNVVAFQRIQQVNTNANEIESKFTEIGLNLRPECYNQIDVQSVTTFFQKISGQNEQFEFSLICMQCGSYEVAEIAAPIFLKTFNKEIISSQENKHKIRHALFHGHPKLVENDLKPIYENFNSYFVITQDEILEYLKQLPLESPQNKIVWRNILSNVLKTSQQYEISDITQSLRNDKNFEGLSLIINNFCIKRKDLAKECISDLFENKRYVELSYAAYCNEASMNLILEMCSQFSPDYIEFCKLVLSPLNAPKILEIYLNSFSYESVSSIIDAISLIERPLSQDIIKRLVDCLTKSPDGWNCLTRIISHHNCQVLDYEGWNILNNLILNTQINNLESIKFLSYMIKQPKADKDKLLFYLYEILVCCKELGTPQIPKVQYQGYNRNYNYGNCSYNDIYNQNQLYPNILSPLNDECFDLCFDTFFDTFLSYDQTQGTFILKQIIGDIERIGESELVYKFLGMFLDKYESYPCDDAINVSIKIGSNNIRMQINPNDLVRKVVFNLARLQQVTYDSFKLISPKNEEMLNNSPIYQYDISEGNVLGVNNSCKKAFSYEDHLPSILIYKSNLPSQMIQHLFNQQKPLSMQKACYEVLSRIPLHKSIHDFGNNAAQPLNGYGMKYILEKVLDDHELEEEFNVFQNIEQMIFNDQLNEKMIPSIVKYLSNTQKPISNQLKSSLVELLINSTKEGSMIALLKLFNKLHPVLTEKVTTFMVYKMKINPFIYLQNFDDLFDYMVSYSDDILGNNIELISHYIDLISSFLPNPTIDFSPILEKCLNYISNSDEIAKLIYGIVSTKEEYVEICLPYIKVLLENVKYGDESVVNIYKLLINNHNTREAMKENIIHMMKNEINVWNYEVKSKTLEAQEVPEQHYYYVKPKLPYCGLNNIGNTCFLNSVLQQMFYTNQFRQALINYPDSEKVSVNNLKILFNEMMNGRKSLSPTAFCRSFIYKNEPLPIGRQQDAAEFFMELIATMPYELTRSMFFEFKDNFKALNIDYQRDSPSLKADLLEIPVQGFSCLEESLASLQKPEYFIGSERYNDPDLGHIDVKKNIEYVSYPDTLVMRLNRFVFVPQLRKLNNYFEIPLELPQLGYKLRGVVIHIGTLQGGHYISIVRINNQFVQFNDSMVSVMSEREFKSTCFGGENTYGSAYMLFYTKLDYNDNNHLSIQELLASHKNLQSNIPKTIDFLFSPDVAKLFSDSSFNDFFDYFLNVYCHSNSSNDLRPIINNMFKTFLTGKDSQQNIQLMIDKIKKNYDAIIQIFQNGNKQVAKLLADKIGTVLKSFDHIDSFINFLMSTWENYRAINYILIILKNYLIILGKTDMNCHNTLCFDIIQKIKALYEKTSLTQEDLNDIDISPIFNYFQGDIFNGIMDDFINVCKPNVIRNTVNISAIGVYICRNIPQLLPSFSPLTEEQFLCLYTATEVYDDINNIIQAYPRSIDYLGNIGKDYYTSLLDHANITLIPWLEDLSKADKASVIVSKMFPNFQVQREYCDGINTLKPMWNGHISNFKVEVFHLKKIFDSYIKNLDEIDFRQKAAENVLRLFECIYLSFGDKAQKILPMSNIIELYNKVLKVNNNIQVKLEFIRFFGSFILEKIPEILDKEFVDSTFSFHQTTLEDEIRATFIVFFDTFAKHAKNCTKIKTSLKLSDKLKSVYAQLKNNTQWNPPNSFKCLNLFSDYQQSLEKIKEEESFAGKNSSANYQQFISNKSSSQNVIPRFERPNYDAVPNQDIVQILAEILLTNCPEFKQNFRQYLKFYFTQISSDEVRNIMYLSSNRLSSSNSDQEQVIQMIYITSTLFEIKKCNDQYKRDYPIDEYRLENWPAELQKFKKLFTNTV